MDEVWSLLHVFGIAIFPVDAKGIKLNLGLRRHYKI